MENANHCSDVQIMLMNSTHSFPSKKTLQKTEDDSVAQQSFMGGSPCIQQFLHKYQAHLLCWKSSMNDVMSRSTVPESYTTKS